MPGSRLCRDEREEIRAGLARLDSFREIARVLERSATTISREVALNGGRERYRAVVAQHRADREARRSRRRKLDADPFLAARIRRHLENGWPPAPISHHLARQGCDVSPETIYRECYRLDGAPSAATLGSCSHAAGRQGNAADAPVLGVTTILWAPTGPSRTGPQSPTRPGIGKAT